MLIRKQTESLLRGTPGCIVMSAAPSTECNVVELVFFDSVEPILNFYCNGKNSLKRISPSGTMFKFSLAPVYLQGFI